MLEVLSDLSELDVLAELYGFEAGSEKAEFYFSHLDIPKSAKVRLKFILIWPE